jgi:hypothetical protein
VKATAFFDLNFSGFFLPVGMFPRLVALVASHAMSAFDGSAAPWLTRSRAVVSFGEADFVMEELAGFHVIRIGVVESTFAPVILELLCSMIDKLREEVMGHALKMQVNLLVKTEDGLIPVAKERKLRKRAPRKASSRAFVP